ncbi:aspartic peptidase A1 [Lactarius psammicola]|nr:aspartic peptidase A1 [Lactarius psammicola]
MFPTALLTAVLLLVISVAANPIVVRKAPVSLSFARRLNITSTQDLIRRDQARARNMFAVKKAKRSGSPGDVGITNFGIAYGANVGIGSPPHFLANTWIGAGKAYVRTGSSMPSPDSVCVTYGSGSFCGQEFTDLVTLSPTLVFRASIGVASTSTGFSGFDGVLGLGPAGLTIGTLSPDTNTPIPTVTDILFSQGIITTNLFSVSFEPTTNTSVKNGELTFGGTDPTQFTGTITFVPITTTFPASEFWGIDESIRYGPSTTILPTTAGILDTGTTLVLIATGRLLMRSNRYKAATGAVNDASTGLLRITSAQFANLQSLFFIIGGTAFEFTANAQIWPRSLNTFIGGTAGSIYLVVNDIGTPSGSGLDFINGYTFLERFYTVYDATNHRIGIATTAFTTATTN